MRRLSGLDASFLALETRTTPMTIGSVSIVDPIAPGVSLGVERLRATLQKRLQEAPSLCRRLHSVPFDLSRPSWADVPLGDLDLDYHVQRTSLPDPGGWRELSELVAWEMAQPLDRRYPLWQLLHVDSLGGIPDVPVGASAIIARVHHAAVDGVSGVEILHALTDRGGEPRKPPTSGVQAEPTEADARAVRRLGRKVLDASVGAVRTLGSSAAGLGGSARSVLRGAVQPGFRDMGDDERKVPHFTAPRSLLNRPVGSGRSWAPALIGLDRIRAVREAHGVTVNDVVLAVSAGALRVWLRERGNLPSEPLVAMVPISVRSEGERREAGNLVSAMLVDLATDEPDALERLARISSAARSAKGAHRTLGARTLVEAADLLPFALSGLGVRLYSRWQLADRHRPLFNLVITNVPGPPRPLAIAGAALRIHVPAAPVFDGLGLVLPVFSYAGTVSFGVTADRAVMPDTGAFAARLEASFDELESVSR